MVVHVVAFLLFQVLNAFLDVVEQTGLVLREDRSKADIVRHVIAAEDGARRFRQVDVLNHQFQLFHEACRRKGRKFSPLELFLKLTAPVEHEAEGRQEIRLDFADGFCGGQCMAFAAGDAGNAQNDHDGKLHSRSTDFFAHLNGLRTGYSLADVPEGFRVARFHAVVEERQSRFTERFQLLRRFAQNISRRSIGGDPLQVGEIFFQGMENFQQTVCGKDKGISVGEENPADAFPVRRIGHGNLPQDLFIGKLFKGDAAVHVAVGAPVVGAASGDAEDKAVCFAGRTENRSIVIIKKEACHSISSFL